MRQDLSPPQEIEIINEAECARRLLVRRETLHRWRKHAGMPYVPLSGKRRAHVRYIWSDVVDWLRARGKGSGVDFAPAPRKVGRPRNVDLAKRKRDDGRAS